MAYRKLFPALYNLYALGSLDNSYHILGIGRRDHRKQDYIENIKAWIKQYARIAYDDDKFTAFSNLVDYYKMNIEHMDEYDALNQYYKAHDIFYNHIYYYAVAPRFFIPITNGLKKHNCCFTSAKVVIEKPFGEDLKAAAHVNKQLSKAFRTSNIYHIDHYLGKEMVQNILNIRFSNAIFKGVWNKDFIENVQINAFESVGVENRGGYYDQSGALKDMVQNHLFQILSIIAMEEPKTFTSDGIHQAQLKLLSKLKPVDTERIDDYLVMAQYNGYRQEPNVNPHSSTETYVAMKVFINTTRWQDVPFYIRTGKKLNNRESEVIVQFKSTDNESQGNILIIKIQPDEGVYLNFNIKKPGTDNEIQKVSMDFCQSCILENRINTPEAYERLIKACMDSDRSWFSDWNQIVTSWNYINTIIESYKTYSNKLYNYEPNTAGPKQADGLLEKSQHTWIDVNSIIQIGGAQ